MERRAATIVPGSSALAKTSVKWPSSRRSTAEHRRPRSRLRCGRGGTAGTPGARRPRCRCRWRTRRPSASSSARSGGVVLDDPVVDDRDLAGGVAVRVGVAVGRACRGWPSGCAPGRCCRRGCASSVSVERGLQVGQPAGPAAHRQAAAAVEQRDTGRVVTAVLHPAQRVDRRCRGQGAARRSRRFRT